MKRISINLQQPEKDKIRTAADILRQGGVIIHPTETVYGLACRWDVPAALKRVQNLKGREEAKPFSLMVASIDEIFAIIGWQDERTKSFLESLFPAPVTVVLPRKNPRVIDYWKNYPELGFRFPDDLFCQQLVRATGTAIITTSANESGQTPPSAPEEISNKLLQKVDLLVDGGPCPLKQPSTVVRIDPNNSIIELLREGSFPFKEIKKIFDRHFSK